MKNILTWLLFCLVAIAIGYAFWSRAEMQLETGTVTVPRIPEEKVEDVKTEEDEQAQETIEPEESASEPPASFQLAVPFTSQAPNAQWTLPYKEACEEASMLMAARFIQGRTIDGPDDADTAILQLTQFTEDSGYPVDTTAAETAALLKDFYDIETEVVEGVDWERIKTEIAQGNPIIIPAAGRQLGNPNFTPPGPPYHMLVITGYTTEGVVTNDPGTRNGEGYVYSYEVLEDAIHDWNGGDVENGAKRFIVVKAE